jgi:hypothetical protein
LQYGEEMTVTIVLGSVGAGVPDGAADGAGSVTATTAAISLKNIWPLDRYSLVQ